MHGKPPWASTLDNALLLDRGPIGSSRARLLPGGLHGKPPWASTLDNALLLDRGPIGSTCCVSCSVRTPDSPPFGQTRLLRSLQTVALGGGGSANLVTKASQCFSAEQCAPPGRSYLYYSLKLLYMRISSRYVPSSYFMALIWRPVSTKPHFS